MFIQKLVGRQKVHGHNCTVKPVKLATFVSSNLSQLATRFMEPAYSYDVTHGHYAITWPPVETCMKLCRNISCEYTIIL